MTLPPRMKQRLTLVGVFLMFMLPILLALVLNMPGVTWRPFGVRNHGELLQPAVSVAQFTLQAVDGGSLPATPLVGGWTVLLVARAPCDSDCKAAIDSLHRIQLSLGEHGGRVQLLWLATGKAELTPTAISALRATTPTLHVVRTPNKPIPAELAAPDTGAAANVIDPRGFLILRYAPGFAARDLLKDLERLLRYSKEP